MMRSLSVVDVVIVLAVIALLIFLGSQDFTRYASRELVRAPTATPAQGS
jgi:hypothetical protein